MADTKAWQPAEVGRRQPPTADPSGSAAVIKAAHRVAMTQDKSNAYPARAAAAFLAIWGIGSAALSMIAILTGQFPGSPIFAGLIIVLVASSLSAASAIHSRTVLLAISSYCIWAATLFGLFLHTVYEPGRPQDLLGYAYALLFLVALGGYLARQLLR